MKKLLAGVNYPFKKNGYDMGHYRKFLKEQFVISKRSLFIETKIEDITVELSSLLEHRFLRPFVSLEGMNDKKIDWWEAYNSVKHSDIDKITEGNLANCLNALAALAVIFVLMDSNGSDRIELFAEMMPFNRVNPKKPFLFTDDLIPSSKPTLS